MVPSFISDSPLLEAAWAAGILFVSILVAWLFFFVMNFIKRRAEKRHKRGLAPQILGMLTWLVFIFVISEGFLMALIALSSTFDLDSWHPYLIKIATGSIIFFVTIGAARSGRLLLGWSLHKARTRQSLVHLIQRITTLLIYITGLLIIMDYAGISVSPLIAGVGLGGLAIALALQPTLSNFFAGAQIVSDRMLVVGDYIELDSGQTGYVIEIGWRSTRVRTPHNNLMIIPNSRLVDSIITNYYGPNMEIAVIVKSGVSYSSDLAHVEKVSIEVAKEIIEELDEAVKTHEPWFSFEEFGDSNINFWIWLYATDRLSAFRVKSELIKRLHARFEKEGITINYPVRLITYENNAPPKSAI